MQVRSLGREDPLEKEMRTHSSLLAWRTPWTEEPGGLQSMSSQKSQTWLCWAFFAVHGLSSCGKQGLSLIVVHGLLIVVTFLLAALGLSSCGA